MIIFLLNYLAVLVYTKTIIHLCVGGYWWLFNSPLRGLGKYLALATFTSVNNSYILYFPVHFSNTTHELFRFKSRFEILKTACRTWNKIPSISAILFSQRFVFAKRELTY